MFIRLALALLITIGGVTAAANPNQAIPQRVLFVGNSYLYYNDSLHNHVERMAIERHPNTLGSFAFTSATIGGVKLQHHNIDWLLATDNIGVDGPFQTVIMQGASFEPLTPEDRATFQATVVRYADKVRAHGAEPMLYMTHAYVPPHPRTDAKMIDIVAQTYLEAAKAAQATVAPVGLAFARSYQQRPNFALHKAFDGTHPNLQGTYLGACVVYLALYGGNLDGLNYDYFGRLPEAEARYLQKIAEQTMDAFQAAAQQ